MGSEMFGILSLQLNLRKRDERILGIQQLKKNIYRGSTGFGSEGNNLEVVIEVRMYGIPLYISRTK